MTLTSQQHLERLVAFDTTSSKSNLQLIEWVANYLDGFGVTSQLVHNAQGDKADLFASLGPSDEGGICLHGHTDVVPVTGQPWNTDPFTLTERNGLLYGRGTCDMKGWIASCLAQVTSYAKDQLRVPVHIALSYDEEIGCLGAPPLIACFGKQLPMPKVALIGEPSLLAPLTAHKGIIALDTVVTGRDAHASLIHLGVSAITAAAEMALELDDIAREWMSLPGPQGMYPSGPTLNVGRMSAGVARNVIPREARLHWELRYRTSDDPTALVNEVHARVQQRIARRFKEQSSALSTQTTHVHQVPPFDAGQGGLAERLVRHLGVRGNAAGAPYGAEAGQYAAAGIASVICGPGSIEQAHQPNEFLALTQLNDCDAMLGRLGVWAREPDWALGAP